MMRWNGLDKDGFIEREGGLERVQQAFAPVVAAARIAIPAAFTRDRLHVAAAVAREPTADRAVLALLIGDLGPWLAAEYVAEHGRKAPRKGTPAG